MLTSFVDTRRIVVEEIYTLKKQTLPLQDKKVKKAVRYLEVMVQGKKVFSSIAKFSARDSCVSNFASS